MSADNGVYILQTKDGFRVTHAQAIENIGWNGDPNFGGFNRKEVTRYFGNCDVFPTEDEALKEACRIYKSIIHDKNCPICEYGINLIEGLKEFDFPSRPKDQSLRGPLESIIDGFKGFDSSALNRLNDGQFDDEHMKLLRGLRKYFIQIQPVLENLHRNTW